MKRLRDPQGRKVLELERDHRVLPRQGNKSFRRAWPLKKAKANRKVRRAEVVAMAAPTEDPDLIEERLAKVHSRRRRRLRKEGVVSLAELLEAKNDIRLRWSQLMEVNREARKPAKRRFKDIK